jgi:DNA-binding beta-propeller fold protein YncE
VHLKSQTLYVAHTSNNSLDVIDCRQDKYLRSIPDLLGVAGVLVSNEKDKVFTSNRGENTVGIFNHGKEKGLEKIKVGGRPNGLAFDYSRDTLLAANVPKLDSKDQITVSIVDVARGTMTADVAVSGRTRWAVFDPITERFYVNIADPSEIVILDAKDPDGLLGSYRIPAAGPHGLDLDPRGRRLFCACDEGRLYEIDLESEKVSKPSKLAGSPDVIFYNSALERLYVTVGNPAVIQVFDTKTMREIQTVQTEPGTHTIAFNKDLGKVYAFMPETHRASVYEET